ETWCRTPPPAGPRETLFARRRAPRARAEDEEDRAPPPLRELSARRRRSGTPRETRFPRGRSDDRWRRPEGARGARRAPGYLPATPKTPSEAPSPSPPRAAPTSASSSR